MRTSHISAPGARRQSMCDGRRGIIGGATRTRVLLAVGRSRRVARGEDTVGIGVPCGEHKSGLIVEPMTGMKSGLHHKRGIVRRCEGLATAVTEVDWCQCSDSSRSEAVSSVTMEMIVA